MSATQSWCYVCVRVTLCAATACEGKDRCWSDECGTTPDQPGKKPVQGCAARYGEEETRGRGEERRVGHIVIRGVIRREYIMCVVVGRQ